MDKDKETPPVDIAGLPFARKPIELGSREVLEKVAEFTTRRKLPPAVDVFTGKKTCHKFFTPVFFFEPSKIQNTQDLRTLVGNTFCIGSKCALWNEERLECLDASKAKADIEVPVLLEQIDGYIRLHHSESGG